MALSYGLHYQYILDHPKAQQQIFKYLPMGLAYGVQISSDDVIMQRLEAYDKTAQLGYVTTLASTWIPSHLIDRLRSRMLDNSNNIYHNPDPSVKQLMSLVLPSIPLLEPSTPSPSPNTGSTGLNSAVKVIIGVLIPVGVIAVLVLTVAYNHQKRRKKHATSLNRANKITINKSRHAFFQRKPELDGEDQMHEVSAGGGWMELDGEGSRRQELQGAEVEMELQGERIRRQELQGGEIAIELHGEASPRQELQGEEIQMQLHGNSRREMPVEAYRPEPVADQPARYELSADG